MYERLAKPVVLLLAVLLIGCERSAPPSESSTSDSSVTDSASTPVTTAPTEADPPVETPDEPDTMSDDTTDDATADGESKVPPPLVGPDLNLRSVTELNIIDVRVGDGPPAEYGKWVVVHSHIVTQSGKVLEDTRAWNTPAEMFLPGLYLEGLHRGIVGMKKGGVRRLEIPPDLAFGDQPPTDVKPGESLFATILCLDVFPNHEARLPSGMSIVSDRRGTGPAAVEGTYVEFRVLVSVGADDRIVYDSRERLGIAETGIPSPAGVFVQRHLEPELPWFSAAIYGMKAGEYRRMEVPPGIAYGGQGYFALGIRRGETIRYEITCEKVHTPPVIEPSSGLKVEDVREGDGRSVVFGRWYTLREKVSLPDGTVVFDNLDNPGSITYAFLPRTGTLGFNRGVMGMRVGGRRTITIPPHLGYGDDPPATAPLITPGATLIWEVELIEEFRVRPAEAPAPENIPTDRPGIPSPPPQRLDPDRQPPAGG